MKTWGKVFLADSRNMAELRDLSVDLVITSPPYYHIKDYGVPDQIGYGQSLHEYLRDLYRVWQECYRVLRPGRRLCINIGDQFARAILYGRYKVIPLHAEVIAQCEQIGFDYMGAIIWQKKTTMRTTGGANVMGSFPYPPNGVVELDYEFILLFKKLGKFKRVSSDEIKEASRLTKEEWKKFFLGHWYFSGARQTLHEAIFPEELPRRLIKMFSFIGDLVLDPFLGSGTTMKVALELGRNAIGYEIQPDFLPIIRRKLGLYGTLVEFHQREKPFTPAEVPEDYHPAIADIKPIRDPSLFHFNRERPYRVQRIISPTKLRLDTGLVVELLGVEVRPGQEKPALDYLRQFVHHKKIFLRFDSAPPSDDMKVIPAYVYLRNKIFINRKMIEMGLAHASRRSHRLLKQFLETERKANAKRMGAKHCD